jgi:hypothetical protein
MQVGMHFVSSGSLAANWRQTECIGGFEGGMMGIIGTGDFSI